MKQIKPVSIWDKGTTYKAEILNVYGIHLELGKNAQFYYSLFAKNAEGQIGMQVSQGNLTMDDAEYAAWGNDDEYIWEFAAKRLNLTIVGDWVAPVIEPIIESTQSVIDETQSEGFADES